MVYQKLNDIENNEVIVKYYTGKCKKTGPQIINDRQFLHIGFGQKVIRMPLDEISKLASVKMTLPQAYVWLKQQMTHLKNITNGEINMFDIGNLSQTVEHLFLEMNNNNGIRILDFDNILMDECRFLENSKMCDYRYKTQSVCQQAYAYDIKSCFPYILSESNFEIPIGRGHFETISQDFIQQAYENTNIITYGMYQCIIEKSEQGEKVRFRYNRDHYYTHIDLIFALTLKLKIVINEVKCNAYVYDKIAPAKIYFGPYLSRMMALKESNPGNIFIKMLSTMLHGVLIRYDAVYIKRETKNIKSQYKYVDSVSALTDLYVDENHPYANPMARMKPFLYAHQRKYVYDNILAKYNDRIVKFITDGFVVDGKIEEFEAFEHSKPGQIIPDKKFPYLGKSLRYDFMHVPTIL